MNVMSGWKGQSKVGCHCGRGRPGTSVTLIKQTHTRVVSQYNKYRQGATRATDSNRQNTYDILCHRCPLLVQEESLRGTVAFLAPFLMSTIVLYLRTAPPPSPHCHPRNIT